MINIFKKKEDDEKTISNSDIQLRKANINIDSKDNNGMSGAINGGIDMPAGDTNNNVRNNNGNGNNNSNNNSNNTSFNLHAFSPPKNLPDLAKDIYDTTSLPISNRSFSDELIAKDSQKNDLRITNNQYLQTGIPREPINISVPDLDLSLIRKHEKINSSDNGNIAAISESANIVNAKSAESVDIQKDIFNKNKSPFIRGSEGEFTRRFDVASDVANDFTGSKNLFMHIENLIHAGRLSEANMLLSNIIGSLNEFHGFGINELTDLEVVWLFMKNKSDALNTLLYGIEAELSLKSGSLGNSYVGTSSSSISSSISSNKNCGKEKEDEKRGISRMSKGISRERSREDFMQLLKNKSINTNGNTISDAPPDEDVIVNDGRVFYVSNGLVLKSLKELIHALYLMSDETFYTHVSNEKNDFAMWVNDVLNRKDIADNIRIYYSKKGLISYLESLFR